jgi:aspartate carbamoyltransferase catalytic subunit
MGWTRKDLLTMRDLEASEIVLLVDTAASLQEIAGREIKKVPALRGKTVVNLFYESSTRTRTSFEIAASGSRPTSSTSRPAAQRRARARASSTPRRTSPR